MIASFVAGGESELMEKRKEKRIRSGDSDESDQVCFVRSEKGRKIRKKDKDVLSKDSSKLDRIGGGRRGRGRKFDGGEVSRRSIERHKYTPEKVNFIFCGFVIHCLSTSMISGLSMDYLSFEESWRFHFLCDLTSNY